MGLVAELKLFKDILCWGGHFKKFVQVVLGLFLAAAQVQADDSDIYANNEANRQAISSALMHVVKYDPTQLPPQDPLPIQKSIEYLSHFICEETAETSFKVMGVILKRIEKVIGNPEMGFRQYPGWFFASFFNLMEVVGNRSDVSQLEDIVDVLKDHIEYLEEADPQYKNSKYKNNLVSIAWKGDATVRHVRMVNSKRNRITLPDGTYDLTKAKAFLKERIDNVLFLTNVESGYRTAKEKGREWITQVRNAMEATAKGQPEVVESFLGLEYSRISTDLARDKPELRFMFGLPGVGKDTHVEAYVDAIHGYEGAHEKHMLRLPVCRTEADAWKLLGSATGYVGSDKLSPLVRFAVEHSGGRYKIEEANTFGRKTEVIREVHNGEGHDPSSAVLFINEFHNWSKEAVDVLLKELIEKGAININSPGDGVSKIYVPLTIVIASNDGMDIVRPKGPVSGDRLQEKEMMGLWEKYHNDYPRLRKELLKRNRHVLGVTQDRSSGLSEEVLDRIPDNGLLLMRPLSAEVVRDIVRAKLKKAVSVLEGSTRLVGPLDITFSDALVERIQMFEHNPEAGARRADDKIETFVKTILKKAFNDEVFAKSEDRRQLHLDIGENSDKSLNLVVKIIDRNGGVMEQKEFLVDASLRLRDPEPIRDEEIQRIIEFEQSLNERVVGAKLVAKKLKESFLLSENLKRSKQKNRARRFMFLGLSSTGKTQTAKEVAQFIYGSSENLATIDFNGIFHESQVDEMIYGRPGHGKSPFMQAYDAADGNLVILLDEIANVKDPNALTPLYALLDEERVTKFNDGEPRSMKNVTIIMTGNLGEEIYRGLPSHIPEHVKMTAMQEIYRSFNADENAQMDLLKTKFREAQLFRIGAENIVFFPPFDFAGVRELVQIKLKQVLKDLEFGNGRSYKLRWENDEEFMKTLKVFETEGFSLWGQGRSIDRFVTEHFRQRVIMSLQENFVPHGAELLVSFKGERTFTDSNSFQEKKELNFALTDISTGRSYDLILDGKNVYKEPNDTVKNLIQTAWHEAGHEIARQALHGDSTEPRKISIVPGIAKIGGEYIYYAGVAVHMPTIRTTTTREEALSHLARLLAGGEAQRLVNRGMKADGGQSNDLERVGRWIDVAVLKLGLAQSWGLNTVPTGQDLNDYISGLSDKQKQELEKARRQFLKEAQSIARRVLASNFEALKEMAMTLAKKGEVYQKEIEDIYKRHPVKSYWETSRLGRITGMWHKSYLKVWWESLWPQKGRGLELVPSVERLLLPTEVIDLEDLLWKRREQELSKAKLMDNRPIISPECRALMAKVSARAS